MSAANLGPHPITEEDKNEDEAASTLAAPISVLPFSRVYHKSEQKDGSEDAPTKVIEDRRPVTNVDNKQSNHKTMNPRPGCILFKGCTVEDRNMDDDHDASSLMSQDGPVLLQPELSDPFRDDIISETSSTLNPIQLEDQMDAILDAEDMDVVCAWLDLEEESLSSVPFPIDNDE